MSVAVAPRDVDTRPRSSQITYLEYTLTGDGTPNQAQRVFEELVKPRYRDAIDGTTITRASLSKRHLQSVLFVTQMNLVTERILTLTKQFQVFPEAT